MNKGTQFNRKKSLKNQIINAMCVNGALTYKSLRYFNSNAHQMQKAAHSLEKEGYVTITRSYGNKNTSNRIIVFNNFWKNYYENFGEIPESYINTYDNLSYISNKMKYSSSQDRICKNIETFCIFNWADIPCYPDEKPSLDNAIGEYAFYTSTEIKNASAYSDNIDKSSDMVNKTIGSRISGLFISPGGAYTIFNVGSNCSKYSMSNEKKMKYTLEKLFKKYNYTNKFDSAILICTSYNTVLKHLNSSIKDGAFINNLYKSYEEIYMVPENETGKIMLQIMGHDSWNERLLYGFLSEEEVEHGYLKYEMDGYNKDTGVYTCIGVIPALDKLTLFYYATKEENDKNKFRLICLKDQEEIYRTFFEDKCVIETVDISEIIDKGQFEL